MIIVAVRNLGASITGFQGMTLFQGMEAQTGPDKIWDSKSFFQAKLDEQARIEAEALRKELASASDIPLIEVARYGE